MTSLYPAEWLERFDPTEESDLTDPRSPFAHDRDRIIYASSFRRLAGKSQVVASGERGNYHTRLTHTLKVAQLGRRVAEQVRTASVGDGPYRGPSDGIVAPDPDLVAASCLAHDLGHPPFGHVGESVLNKSIDAHLAKDRPFRKWSNAQCVAVGGFEGNAQTFRILTYLAVRHEAGEGHERSGLNLTKATLAATVKYPWLRSDTPDPDWDDEKWGAYGQGDDVRLKTLLGEANVGYLAEPTYEAQLMDWCDDVTYAVHDIIDFYQSGLIAVDRLLALHRNNLSLSALEFLHRVHDYRREQNEEAKKKHGSAVRREYDLEEMIEAWRLIANCSFINQPWAPKLSVKAAVHKTTHEMIRTLVQNVGWAQRGTRNSRDYVFGSGRPMLFDGDFVVDPDPVEGDKKRLAVALLKHAIRFNVIDQPRMASQQRGQEAIVRELFCAHAEEPRLLPPDRQEELAIHGEIVRAASDHVASLTEADAVALFRRFSGVSLGAFSDVL